MRVVAGVLRGRTVKAVPGMTTRPTLDKVKESVFNAMGQFFSGGTALDLFAGSGNLGIEALSRGADKCVFVDYDYKAFRVIEENIQSLNLKEKSELLKMDAFKALGYFENKYRFDYVFLDPPYKIQKINDILTILTDRNLLNDDAQIVCECLKEDELIREYKSLCFLREYIYGITKITIYKKSGDRNE